MIRQLKAYAKAFHFDTSFDPYKAAYGSMPSHSAAHPEIKQMYINGHFCYAYKFGIVTNGLGIVRHISFYNKDFIAAHPEIIVEKKSDSPDEDKSLADAKALIPTLGDFFKAHPLINPKVFLGDASFDCIGIYKALLTGDTFGAGRHFHKAYIPLNRARLENKDYSVNEDGIPCCPNDPSLPMKPEGNTSHLRCKLPTFKFVCPKMKWQKCEDGKHRRVTSCENPCSSSLGGRMVYVYPEKDLRAFPGTIRGTKEWAQTYKIRATVEKSINHFKSCFCTQDRKTRNDKTIHADLLLSGITHLVTVILADCIQQHNLLMSLKPIAA
jgi:hypothetical protein